MRVADYMSGDPISFRTDQLLVEVEEVLVRKKITGAPVVADERVVGVISRSDLIRQLELERSRIEAASEPFEPFDQPGAVTPLAAVSSAVATRWIALRVEDVMRHEVFEISPDDSLAEAARRMVLHEIHRLAVLDDKRLVGMISSLDVLRAIAEQADE